MASRWPFGHVFPTSVTTVPENVPWIQDVSAASDPEAGERRCESLSVTSHRLAGHFQPHFPENIGSKRPYRGSIGGIWGDSHVLVVRRAFVAAFAQSLQRDAWPVSRALSR